MQKEVFSFITFDDNTKMKEIITNSQSMKLQQQTGKCIDTFEDHFNSLKACLHDSSKTKLKIYEYVKYIYAWKEDKQTNIIVACIYLMLMEILLSSKNNQQMADKQQCQNQMQNTKNKIQLCCKHQSFAQIIATVHQVQKIETQNHFIKGFNRIWKLITKECYKYDVVLWKLITFYRFLFIKNCYKDSKQVNKVQITTAFRYFLQSQQKGILNVPLVQRSQYDLKISSQSNKNYTKRAITASMKPNFGVKELMILQINNQIIELVDRCQTYNCPFIIFLIPFSYLLAETFTYYTNFTSLYSYQIFSGICKKVMTISKSKNPQLNPNQIEFHLTNQLNLKRSNNREYTALLGQFLNKYSAKMSTFIPVFYQIFAFHAYEKYDFVDKVYKQHKKAEDRRKKIKQRIQLLYQECKKDYFEDI